MVEIVIYPQSLEMTYQLVDFRRYMDHFIIALYAQNMRAVVLDWQQRLPFDFEIQKLIKYRDMFNNPGFDVRLEINPIITDDILNSKPYKEYEKAKQKRELEEAQIAIERHQRADAANDPAFKKVLEGLERSSIEPVEISIYKLK